jgi:putative hydrolase of HD superfamily
VGTSTVGDDAGTGECGMNIGQLHTTLTQIAALTLKLGEVDRITQHPDGRAETDTTHTVMLALCALEMYNHVSSEHTLDPYKLVVYALVHDLLEAYTGDMPTLVPLTGEQQTSKEQNEHEAYWRLVADIPRMPWLPLLIDRYREQTEPEARFIRYLDKIMPKLTHTLNAGAAIRAQGLTRRAVLSAHLMQGEKLRAEYPEYAVIHALFDHAAHEAVTSYAEDAHDA